MAEEMPEGDCSGNCHDCRHARGPTGTEGCEANPRAICMDKMLLQRDYDNLVKAVEVIPFAKINSALVGNGLSGSAQRMRDLDKVLNDQMPKAPLSEPMKKMAKAAGELIKDKIEKAKEK